MSTQSIKRNTNLCSTGIPGLDVILEGGLARNRFYLIQGDPGVGKTTLAIQFLLEGVRQGERVLYITLSETKEELLTVADSHNWSFDDIAIFELSAIEQQLSAEAQTTLFYPSEVELNQTTNVLLDEVERVRPSRVVFDSLSEMRLLAQNPLRFRRQMLSLKQYFNGRNITVLLLDDRVSDDTIMQVQSIAHGVIEMQRISPIYGPTRRRITVVKLRGVRYREGYHDFMIKTGGLEVFPRLVAGDHKREFAREMVSSSLGELDSLLGGGLDRGTSTIIVGAAGVGKSSLSTQYAVAAAERGEKSTIYIFDENIDTFIARSEGLGMEVRTHIDSGLITIHQMDPADHSPGELAHLMRSAVERHGTGLVIIDSLNGYTGSMPEEPLLLVHLHELLAYLSHQGVVSILVMAQHGLLGDVQSPANVTFLADTVIYMRFFEVEGTVRKAISVIKKRSGRHETTIREIRMNGGIRVGGPITSFQGILTGAPVYSGTMKQIIDNHDGVS